MGWVDFPVSCKSAAAAGRHLPAGAWGLRGSPLPASAGCAPASAARPKWHGGSHVPGAQQHDPARVPDADVPREPGTAASARGWKRRAGAGNAPSDPGSRRPGSSSGPATLLHVKLNLPPQWDAANGATTGPSHPGDAWLSQRGARASLEHPSSIPPAHSEQPMRGWQHSRLPPRPPRRASPQGRTPRRRARSPGASSEEGRWARRGEGQGRRWGRAGAEAGAYRPARSTGSFRCRRWHHLAASAWAPQPCPVGAEDEDGGTSTNPAPPAPTSAPPQESGSPGNPCKYWEVLTWALAPIPNPLPTARPRPSEPSSRQGEGARHQSHCPMALGMGGLSPPVPSHVMPWGTPTPEACRAAPGLPASPPAPAQSRRERQLPQQGHGRAPNAGATVQITAGQSPGGCRRTVPPRFPGDTRWLEVAPGCAAKPFGEGDLQDATLPRSSHRRCSWDPSTETGWPRAPSPRSQGTAKLLRGTREDGASARQAGSSAEWTRSCSHLHPSSCPPHPPQAPGAEQSSSPRCAAQPGPLPPVREKPASSSHRPFRDGGSGWHPHPRLASPPQADVPIPGWRPPVTLLALELVRPRREQAQARGRLAGSVSESGSVRVMGTGWRAQPGPCSPQHRPWLPQLHTDPGPVTGGRNTAPGYVPAGGTGDWTGCPSPVALGMGQGAGAWWHWGQGAWAQCHPVLSPHRLQPGPTAGGGLSPGSYSQPSWGWGSGQPQAQWLCPEHHPGGVSWPPAHGPGPMSLPGAGAPLPSAAGNIFFLSVGLQRGGSRKNPRVSARYL